MMFKNGDVYLELDNSATVHYPLSEFSEADRNIIDQKNKQIDQINQARINGSEPPLSQKISGNVTGLVSMICIILLLSAYFYFRRKTFNYLSFMMALGILSVAYSFTIKSVLQATTYTSPSQIDSAFIPFKPTISTSFDANYFYVHSLGIPATHTMMSGITNWQQQVPIPQCYIGSNAWSVPLNSTLAATPVPVNQSHFTKGAIAIAVNGVAIFNPFTNAGVDAYLDGQLDGKGGHCGRADDYHYHIAPLHLYSSTSATLPIAYALDGYAVYGSSEPNGSPMQALDANHGHFGSNGVYHYHGTSSAPYMIGNMVGKVTEDANLQIIPQAQSTPIRPAQNPLGGAVITSCVPNGNNGYILTYILSGQTYQVSYNWTNNGVYTFNFINPGNTTTNIYNGFIQCVVPTSINNLSLESRQIDVYPNPSSNDFNLKLSEGVHASDVINISLYNSSGKLMYSFNGFLGSIKNSLPKDIYFLVIKTNKEILTKKLIVE